MFDSSFRRVSLVLIVVSIVFRVSNTLFAKLRTFDFYFAGAIFSSFQDFHIDGSASFSNNVARDGG